MTRWSSLALALALVLGTASAAEHSYERPCMGTLFRVVVHSERPTIEVEAATNAAFELAARLDACLSDYRADSEVGRFHRSPASTAFKTSATLADILGKASRLQMATAGAFDPARGAQTWLWRLTRRTGKLPPADKLAVANSASGWDQLEFDPTAQALTRRTVQTRLDFGGIAKGYTADLMLALLVERGFPSSSIAAGGDVRLGAPPPGRRGWKVDIRPSDTRTTQGTALILANAAVSTSGSAEQQIEIDAVRYSHIIDPATGLGMKSARSATVVAPTATQSDALATALCILGEAGLPLIGSRTGCAGAIFEAPQWESPSVATTNFGQILSTK